MRTQCKWYFCATNRIGADPLKTRSTLISFQWSSGLTDDDADDDETTTLPPLLQKKTRTDSAHAHHIELEITMHNTINIHALRSLAVRGCVCVCFRRAHYRLKLNASQKEDDEDSPKTYMCLSIAKFPKIDTYTSPTALQLIRLHTERTENTPKHMQK